MGNYKITFCIELDAIKREQIANEFGIPTTEEIIYIEANSPSQVIICVLLTISILAISVIGIIAFLANRPQNCITPIEQDSIWIYTIC